MYFIRWGLFVCTSVCFGGSPQGSLQPQINCPQQEGIEPLTTPALSLLVSHCYLHLCMYLCTTLCVKLFWSMSFSVTFKCIYFFCIVCMIAN